MCAEYSLFALELPQVEELYGFLKRVVNNDDIYMNLKIKNKEKTHTTVVTKSTDRKQTGISIDCAGYGFKI